MSESENNKDTAKATDLDWLAFCYIAGELNQEQTVDFELRLERDQSARDAVAQAVRLSEEVYESTRGFSSAKVTVGHESISEERKIRNLRKRQNRVWQTAVAVLMGASLGAWLWTTSQNDSTTVVESVQEDLAVAWVDGLDEADTQEAVLEASDEFGFEDDTTNEWMLAALVELDQAEKEATN